MYLKERFTLLKLRMFWWKWSFFFYKTINFHKDWIQISKFICLYAFSYAFSCSIVKYRNNKFLYTKISLKKIHYNQWRLMIALFWGTKWLKILFLFLLLFFQRNLFPDIGIFLWYRKSFPNKKYNDFFKKVVVRRIYLAVMHLVPEIKPTTSRCSL